MRVDPIIAGLFVVLAAISAYSASFNFDRSSSAGIGYNTTLMDLAGGIASRLGAEDLDWLFGSLVFGLYSSLEWYLVLVGVLASHVIGYSRELGWTRLDMLIVGSRIRLLLRGFGVVAFVVWASIALGCAIALALGFGLEGHRLDLGFLLPLAAATPLIGYSMIFYSLAALVGGGFRSLVVNLVAAYLILKSPLLFAPLKIDKASSYSAADMVLRGIVEPSLVILAVGLALLAATMVYARWRWEL